MANQQLSFDFFSTLPSTPPVKLDEGAFSHDQICNESARIKIEEKYTDIIEETDKFSRKTVSFQASKISTLHRWFKYREGFSSKLVEILLDEFGTKPGDSILDPFSGSCTTLLEAKLTGINAIGIELLPHCFLAWKAKSKAFDYDIEEIKKIRNLIVTESPPESQSHFPHLSITETAFPEYVERDILDYSAWLSNLPVSDDAKILFRSLIMSLLEDVSYTRKDGQYLRWDGRAEKIVLRNQARVEQGKKPIKGINKGQLPSVKESLLKRTNTVIRDIIDLQKDGIPQSSQKLIKGSTLFELPKLKDNTIDAVVTSPPYANRYDYTRTYALELAYLNVDNEIFSLRQSMLSCTVENRSKKADLRRHYEVLGAKDRYEKIQTVIKESPVLKEISAALKIRRERGEINNVGVLRMIDQYFVELAFVFAELFRVCKRGSFVAFVNDNVRYAGEVIPVDLISTSIAESLGFEPVKVYVIPQRKGNSSQQMKKFGRRELRKSITIWKKPE